MPGEIIYSTIKKELEKAEEKPRQKLETALKNISNSTINPSDSEKLKLEKEIKTYREQLEEYQKKINQGKATDNEKFLHYLCLKRTFSFESY